MRGKSLFRLIVVSLLMLTALSPSMVLAGSYDDAVTALTEGDYREAYRSFKRLAQRDHVEAQYQLGMLYLFGQGVDQNAEQGIEWLGRAAHNGSYAAANELSQVYISGRGVPVNEQEAIKWMELATQISEQDESVASDGCE